MNGKNTTYIFGAFTYDTGQKCLLHNNEFVPVSPKVLETLDVLVENRGRIVDKDHLMARVWEDTYVEESSLAQNISKLRKIFSSHGGDPMIETIPRRGYRFTANVSEKFGDSEVLIVERETQTDIVDEEEIFNTDPGADDVTDRNGALVKSDRTERPNVSRATLLWVAGGTAMTLFAYMAYAYLGSTSLMDKHKFKEYKTTTLMSSGDVTLASISPDGNYLGFIEKNGKIQRLLVRQVTGGKAIELVAKPDFHIVGLKFSPDSQSIYYTAYPVATLKRGDTGRLYRVPIMGGASEEVVVDIDSPAALSPDGKSASFVRYVLQTNESQLVHLDLETKWEKVLASRTRDSAFSGFGPTWSLDGKYLSIAANDSSNLGYMELLVIDSANNEQTSLLRKQARELQQTAWLKDGSGIIITATGDTTPNITDEIWLVSFPDGEARRIAGDVNCLFGLSISSDSNSIVTVRGYRFSTFWQVLTKKNAGTIEGVDWDQASVVGKNVGDNSLWPLGVGWTNNNKLVYSKVKGGNAEIFIAEDDGQTTSQLTFDEKADTNPKVAPDNSIVFLSNRQGSFNLWRMQQDGSGQERICDYPNVSSHSISSDGKWVYFEAGSTTAPGRYLWKVSTGGGEAVPLSLMEVRSPSISPDGKYVIGLVRLRMQDGTFSGPFRLSLLSAEDANVVKQFESPARFHDDPNLQWLPDGSGVTYLTTENGMSDIWFQPIQSDSPRELGNSRSDQILRYAWSEDGSRIGLEKGMVAHDILLLTDLSNK